MEEVVGIHGEAWSCLVQEFQLKMEGLRERREELETKELDLRRSLEKFNTFLTVIKPTVELSSTPRGKKIRGNNGHSHPHPRPFPFLQSSEVQHLPHGSKAYKVG